jgi:hypothetical protein
LQFPSLDSDHDDFDDDKMSTSLADASTNIDSGQPILRLPPSHTSAHNDGDDNSSNKADDWMTHNNNLNDGDDDDEPTTTIVMKRRFGSGLGTYLFKLADPFYAVTHQSSDFTFYSQ